MFNKRDKNTIIFMMVTMILFLVIISVSQTQAALLLEGALSVDGIKVADGEKTQLTVRIFDDEYAGKLLYEERHQAVIKQGKVSIRFASGKITVPQKKPLPPAAKLWVEIETAGQVLAPRLNLAEIDSQKVLSSSNQSLRASLRTAGSSGLIIGGSSESEMSFASDKEKTFSCTNSYYKGNAVYGETTGQGHFPDYPAGGYFLGTQSHSLGVVGVGGSVGVRGKSEVVGVLGSAIHTDIADSQNYGGNFLADGIDESCGVYGKASNETDVLTYGGHFVSYSVRGIGAFGHGTGDNGRGLYGTADGSTGIGVVGWAGKEGSGITNYGGYFKAEGDSGYGVWASGKAFDFYAGGPGSNYGPFTGTHEVKLAADMPKVIKPGMIVVVTGKAEMREDEKTGKLCFSSTLPTVTLAAKSNDKAVFGVLVAEEQLSEDHWYKGVVGERFGLVNALGEGVVWVSNINGAIVAGDYITTSTLSGYGQLQDDDVLHSYTLGKATATIDWNLVDETIVFQGKKYKISPVAVVYTSG